MSMGGILGGIVGGILGFFIGGPTGALYGASIGFSLGMMIDPMTPDIPTTGTPLPMGADVMINTVGDPLPDLTGTAKITGHLLFYGKERTVTIEQEQEGGKGGGSPDPVVTGYEYYMSWGVGIVTGPIDTLYAIYKGDDVIWEGELNIPESGGQETIILTGYGPPITEEEGSILDPPVEEPTEESSMGSATFYFGTNDQIANTNVGEIIGDDTLNSPYRNFCWCFFDDCYLGTFNRCPTIKFVLRKAPDIAFSGSNEIQTYDYNPMHTVWYALHDLAGLPETWLHTEDFATAAATLASETRGICCFFDKQQSTLDYLQAINNHIDGIIRYGSDGKFHPKLIRDDYTVSSLPLIDENVMLDDPTFSRKAWGDTVNEMKVQYTEIVQVRPPDWTTEIYFELLKSEIGKTYITFNTNGQYVIHLPSMVDINVNEFNGVTSWEFEAIWCNRTENDARLQIVDDEDNVYADMLLESGLSGYSDYNLFRTRTEFTPGAGDITYMLRFDNQKHNFYSNDIAISAARIVLTQFNATKTKIQIPMFSGRYNYALQYYFDDGNYGIGWPVYDNESGAFSDNWSDIYTDHIMSKAASTIWKYDQAELNTVSKVIFNVDAKGGNATTTGSKVEYLLTSSEIVFFRFMLYWAPASASDAACDNATPAAWVSQTQVHTDGCTGAVFTPIPGSYHAWDKDVDEYPYTIECYPDFSGVPHDAKIFTGGEIRLIGAGLEPWQHYNKYFDNPATASVHLVNEKLIIESTDTNKNTTTFTADKTQSESDLTIALWNVTDSILVSGSELVWVFEDGYSRKSAEVSLKNECEYKIVAKAEGYYSDTYTPTFYDAQLLLNINPISKLTIWQRVTHCYDDYWDNWTIPAGWTASSIGSRIKLLLPENTKSYFEQTGFYVEEQGRDAYIALEDLGVDDSTGSGEDGTDVTDGRAIWAVEEEGLPLRKRTGELELTNEHIYDNKQPDGDDEYLYLGTGFIVLKVKQ